MTLRSHLATTVSASTQSPALSTSRSWQTGPLANGVSVYVLANQPITMYSSWNQATVVSWKGAVALLTVEVALRAEGRQRSWAEVKKGREDVPSRSSQRSCFMSHCCSLISTERWFKRLRSGGCNWLISDLLLLCPYDCSSVTLSHNCQLGNQARRFCVAMYNDLIMYYVLVLKTWPHWFRKCAAVQRDNIVPYGVQPRSSLPRFIFYFLPDIKSYLKQKTDEIVHQEIKSVWIFHLHNFCCHVCILIQIW